MGNGIWDMGYGIWEMGYGRWDMGNGRWDMGYGIWEMGYGNWEMGNGADEKAAVELYGITEPSIPHREPKVRTSMAADKWY